MTQDPPGHTGPDHTSPSPAPGPIDPVETSGPEQAPGVDGPQPAEPTPARGRAAKTLLRGASWESAAQIIPLAVNLAMTPWVIHGLGPARYSVFLLISSVVALLGNLDGGIGQSAMRFFTLYAGRDDRLSTTRLLTSVSALVVGGWLVVMLVVLPLTGRILDFFRLDPALYHEAQVLMYVMVPVTGLLFWRNLYSSVVFARQRFGIMAIAKLLSYAAYTIGTILTIVYGWGLYGIAGALVAQSVVLGFVSVPTGLRYLDRRGLGFVSGAEFREFFSYAWRVQVSGLMSFLGYQKDQLVAGRILSAQASGPFGQGTSFATQLSFMPNNAHAPIQAMTGQRVGRLGAAGAAPSIEAVQRVWVRFVTGWCVVGAPAAYFGVRAWLPDSYATAGTVSAILIFGNVFWLITVVTMTWALTLGRSEIEMRANIAALVTNVVLSVVLYQVMGMIGIVVATALGKVAMSLMVSFDTRRRLDVNLRWFLLEVPVVAAVVGFLASAGAGYLAAPYLPRGAIGLLCAGLVAAVPMLVYGLLAARPSEWRAGWAMLRSR